MQHDGGRLAFQETTDRIIQALGIRTGKQRLDSTHIMSNIATLTRLGLFCETMRLFLRALRWEHPELRPVVPEGLLGRYLKEEDEATHYEDARTGEGRRRLSVCARDLYRLVDRFHGTTAAQLEEYRLLERLLREHAPFPSHEDLLRFVEVNSGLDGSPTLPGQWSTVAEYLSMFDGRVAVNIAYVIGNSPLRISAVGWDDRPVSGPEMENMKAILREGMEEGAYGISTGLDYPPGSSAVSA